MRRRLKPSYWNSKVTGKYLEMTVQPPAELYNTRDICGVSKAIVREP
jgi:hypothetical protein